MAEGVLPEDTNANALSGSVMAVTQGMSVLAHDGATRDELLVIIGIALAGWPGGGMLPTPGDRTRKDQIP
jgi:hypothetical protein